MKTLNDFSSLEKNNLHSATVNQQSSQALPFISNNSICNEFNDINDANEKDTLNLRNDEITKTNTHSGSCGKLLCSSPFWRAKKFITRSVTSKYFDQIIFCAIILNTISMAIEFHGQPQWITDILEYTNLFFTIVFTVEMIFKIIAEGCLRYVNNLFNVFDAIIVIISLIELHKTKSSGLTVLRTFRLLRVLKLVRFFPTLRRQLVSRNSLNNH